MNLKPMILIPLVFGLVLTRAALAQPAAPDEVVLNAVWNHLVNNPTATADVTDAQWKTYSGHLEQALATDHDGLRQGAMRMIIQYGDNLSIGREAVFNLVRLYRDHRNEGVRRMAVVALGQTGDTWAMDFLTRSARFEKSAAIRHTIYAVLAAYYVPELGPSRSGGS